MAKSKGISYFPFYFELLPTLEDLESDGFKVSLFLRAICEYASNFQYYDNALDDPNPIPPAVSGSARQYFRAFKAKIDPRLNALKSQGLHSALNGASGGRPRSLPSPPPQENLNRLSKTRTGFYKPEKPEQVSPPNPSLSSQV